MRVMKDEDRPMTVKEIADTLGEVPAKVHYHVKKLESIGVLYIKQTRVINGIVAKYYDFTADTITLSVHSDAENADLSSLLVKTYGAYFDEAKQHFFDLYNIRQDSPILNDNNVFFYVKNTIPLDPDKFEELSDELRALMEKYRCNDEKRAADYSAFFSVIQIPKR